MALAAMLTMAPVCLAADSSGAPGQGSLGGGFGFSSFLADGDYTLSRDGTGTGRDVWKTRDASSRFAFAADLRYQASKHVRWQLSPGFLWAGYNKRAPIPFRTNTSPTDSLKGKVLTLMLPISAQIQLCQRTKNWMFHEGAGPGIYRIWLEQNRRVIKDPVTKKLHVGFYPGGSAEIGAEYFLKSQTAVSIEFTATSHFAFAQRDEQFVSGFDSNVWTAEGRIGVNYHFDPRALHKNTGKAAPKK
jgi:hypothetical protein